MIVIGSIDASKDNRVYHKRGCIYEKRILDKNKVTMSLNKADRENYCACAYCAGLRGEVRVSQEQFKELESKHNIHFRYMDNSDTLYIFTDIGFWKIYWKEDLRKYVLFHRNTYHNKMSFYEAIHGDFHRQKDVYAKEYLITHIRYIIAHDKAKVTMKDDYRKLPQDTKKQKKYYRQAKKKAKHKAIQRVDSIFLALEAQNPELKYAYKDASNY